MFRWRHWHAIPPLSLVSRSLPTCWDKLDRCRTSPKPSPYGDQRPNCLKQSERPRSLQEPVGGAEDAGGREGQDERSAAIFQSVADQHRRNRRQSEKSEGIHGGVHPTGMSIGSRRSTAAASRAPLGSRTSRVQKM